MLEYTMTCPEQRFHYCMSLLGFFVDYAYCYSFLYTIRVYNKHFLYQSFRTDDARCKTGTSSNLLHLEDFIESEMEIAEEYNQIAISPVVITSYVTI